MATMDSQTVQSPGADRLMPEGVRRTSWRPGRAERRRHPRIVVNDLPCTLRSHDGELVGVIQDISASGLQMMRVRGSVPAVGSRAALTALLPSQKPLVMIAGIRSVRQDGERISVGLRIDAMESEAFERWMSYLYDLMMRESS